MMAEAFHIDAGTVPIASDRPLLIVDADEVLLAFAQGLDRFLNERGCYLDLVSYRLYGNVRRRDDNTALIDIEVTALLEEFRNELDWLEPIEGVREAMAALARDMDIVVVSNITAAQAPARLRNLSALGVSLPLLANSGPKGPVAKTLARRAGRPVFFMDDIPMHHASVAEHAPDVVRIHFVGDARLKALLPPSSHAHVRIDDWAEASAYIRDRLKGE